MNAVKNEVVQAALSDEESSDLDNDDALDFGAAVFPNNVNTEAEEEDDEQIFRCKDHVGRFRAKSSCLWALAAAKYNEHLSRSYCVCCFSHHF